MIKRTDDFAKQQVQDTLKIFQVDREQGLTEKEVKERLEKYGYNEIREKEEPLWHRIFRRFWGPIPWMIEAAAFLSALVKKWEDFVIITILLFVNGFLDFMQEHRALNALKALKQHMTREVTVFREGIFRNLSVRELVPGDIIKLRIGDIVPADVQLLEGDYLLVDQAALTGESLPVSKKRSDVAYANTIVKQGEMSAVVVNTGMNTNFHTVVALVAKAELEEVSHFQRMVIQIGHFLILITIGLVLVIIMAALFRGDDFMEIARFALVLTIASIPVALPAVLSVTMAVGALNLARRRAIVSRLTAIEELAGVDVFCSDKTGTLTKNKMTVADPVVLDGYNERELFLFAALASRIENRDPIELPIFHYIDEHLTGLDRQSWRQTHFTPFDPVSKRTEAEIEKDGERFIAMKGAPQILLELANLPENEELNVTQMVDMMAAKGYRTIAVGRKKADGPLELIGLIPLFDPPREDSRHVIEEMENNGVQVKMVTGDNAAIAREIGGLLGLKQRTIRSAQLSGRGSNELMALAEALSAAIYKQLKPEISERESERFASEVMKTVAQMYDTFLLDREFIHTHESAIIEMIEMVDIFAEVVPEDKYRIVNTLQKGNHIVAMTGDGVNDAPALKKADCGIAVSNATDAARAVADIILTAPGLSVINEAVKQARIIFGRMKSYTIFRIAETLRIVLFMTLSILVFNFYPVTAVMIIILALLNDIPILAIAYDNAKVEQKPVRWNMREVLTVATVLGLLGVASSFLIFYFLEDMGFSAPLIQAMIFMKLDVAGHSTIYVARTGERHFWEKPYPSLKLFLPAFATRIIGTLIACYGLFMAAVGWEYTAYIWIYATIWFLVNDFVKVWVYRMLRSKGWLAAGEQKSKAAKKAALQR